MTIHSSHPFLPPENDRDPVRRMRGRLVGPVTLWTAAHEGARVGLTVGSVTIADGAPAAVLGLIDPEADVLPTLDRSGTFAVSVLLWADRHLADAFAGLAPAPGGWFGMATWLDTTWGPVPPARSWMGCRLVERRSVGYGELVTGEIESLELVDGDRDGSATDLDNTSVLARLRGRYVAVRSPIGPH